MEKDLIASAMRLLLIEDDRKLSALLTRGLREEGFAVDATADGDDGAWSAVENDYDAIILDVMLPGMDGFQVLEKIRAKRRRTPVLMLTARATLQDRVRGLNSGADDYLKKPFDFEELLARIQALHRRSEGTSIDRTLGDVTLDGRHRALRGGTGEVALTAREYALAAALFERAGDVRTRAELLREVWGTSFEGDPNVLDVYVGYLRQKLARLGGPPLRVPALRAVRGIGFRLILEDAR